MGQSSEFEREIKQKTGGASGGASQKSGGAMAPPGTPLESPLCVRLVDALGKYKLAVDT